MPVKRLQGRWHGGHVPGGRGTLDGRTALGGGGLPVVPALGELLPGGLRRGTVVMAEDWGLLCLALAAGASAAGAWCAVAGIPQFGVMAAVGAGLDPDRMLLVADPGAGWPQVVASLLDGCELVLLRPPDRPNAQVRRRLEAALRRSGGVLVVAGDWEGAQVRLCVTHREWSGIGEGHGRLAARRVQVVAEGRGAAAQPKARWLWLPGTDGSVSSAEEAPSQGQTVRDTGQVMRDTGLWQPEAHPPGRWWCGARAGQRRSPTHQRRSLTRRRMTWSGGCGRSAGSCRWWRNSARGWRYCGQVPARSVSAGPPGTSAGKTFSPGRSSMH